MHTLPIHYMFMALMLFIVWMSYPLHATLYMQKDGSLSIRKSVHMHNNLKVDGHISSPTLTQLENELDQTETEIYNQRESMNLFNVFKSKSLPAANWISTSDNAFLPMCGYISTRNFLVCWQTTSMHYFAVESMEWRTGNTAAQPSPRGMFGSTVFFRNSGPNGSPVEHYFLYSGKDHPSQASLLNDVYVIAADHVPSSSSESWDRLTTNPGISERAHIYPTFHRGRIWFYGGQLSSGQDDGLYYWNPNDMPVIFSSDAVTKTGHVARGAMTIGSGDYIYTLTGKDSSELVDCFKYGPIDDTSPTFTPIASMTTSSVYGAGLTVPDSSFIYYLNGYESGVGRSGKYKRYSIQQNQWDEFTLSGDVPSSKDLVGFAVADSLVYFIGGSDGSNQNTEFHAIYLI